MEDNPDSHEDDFQNCAYSNASSSIDTTILQFVKAPMTSEWTISEEIIAVFGAIPSSALIYILNIL